MQDSSYLHTIETVEETDDENLLHDIAWLRRELAEASAGRESDLMRLLLSRVTLNNMFQFCALLDTAGTMWDVNDAALRGGGLTRRDIHGKPFWEAHWWQTSPGTPQRLREAIAEAARGEFVRYDVEVIGGDGGKEIIIIDFNIKPVADGDGVVHFLICEGRDVTEQRRLEQEVARQREELARLDELKTQFFANISHEFRTPLTLMLGPIEDALADRNAPLSEPQRARIAMAERNGLRLQKLVNALLDFSRVEAGRIQAVYQPSNLASLTSDLASSFRAACEKAGLSLSIDAEALPQPVYVDREMWEKIVLNLVSNAFKFTLAGGIVVEMRAEGADAVLRVRDTGVGIPEAELPRIFERFHRVAEARGRTYEGTGIGLALVQELVKLHKGAVEVESTFGRGATFTVRIPFGSAHLPESQIESVRGQTSTATRAEAFVSEALRWLPDGILADVSERADAALVEASAAGTAKPRLVVADDNADMREYLCRILEPHYEVVAVGDGEEALAEILKSRPDLLLTDVMMPKLDGFQLLQQLRADAGTRDMPVIVLSARAGEEAKVEGLEMGADDYLVKPFAARELFARVAANIKLSGFRSAALRNEREGAERLQRLADAFLTVTAAPDLQTRLEIVSEHARATIGAHMSVVGLTQGMDWSQAIQAKSLSDKYAHYRNYTTVPDGAGIYALVCETNRPLCLTEDELHAHPRWRGSGQHAKQHPRLRGWLAVPLIGSDGSNLGLIQLADKYEGEFTEADQSILIQLAQLASAVIERDKAAEELHHINETLELRVEHEIRQRAETEDTLRQAQKMDAIGQLTGGVAHDFNNLLTIMLGGLEAIDRQLPSLPDSPTKTRITNSREMSMEGVRRAATLTSRLLAFARRQPLAPVGVDANKLVAGIAELLRRTVGEAVSLETDLADEACMAFVDSNQLENALLNLALNARDAMPEGGKLKIETANCDFDDKSATEGGSGVTASHYVMLAVTDTGLGMDRTTLDKAFEPFFTTKGVGKGTGLGLSQVYGFVQQSSGHVKIVSEPGHGTTVKIYLPRHLGEDGGLKQRETEEPSLKGSETILVVEDDDTVRRYATESLREMGYRVIYASNGTEALERLASHGEISLLFTDVIMPGGMNGRELADIAVRRHPRLKVLFTTGYSRDAIVHHGRLDPGIRLITKPFTFKDLAKRVRQCLDGQGE
jgi:PAS domain S-box-containing protein